MPREKYWGNVKSEAKMLISVESTENVSWRRRLSWNWKDGDIWS